jgi:hypothetical protein
MTPNRGKEKCLCRCGVTERASHFPVLVRKIVLIFTLVMFMERASSKHRVCCNNILLLSVSSSITEILESIELDLAR